MRPVSLCYLLGLRPSAQVARHQVSEGPHGAQQRADTMSLIDSQAEVIPCSPTRRSTNLSALISGRSLDIMNLVPYQSSSSSFIVHSELFL